jgi:6-pyruvoyltetrahydropterin/6-carboxytetrahydropterin synthase
MYTVSVRGHMMVAHSFQGADFGPAQKLHGATYVVDVEFRKADLNADNILVDIGRAADTLNGILSGLSYRNLDEDPSFEGRNTTTEFLARIVFDRMVAALKRGELGMAARGVEGIKVTLHESHVASASYEDDIT